jgi:formylglycine-generating enzyme required for sulfatase activity
MGCTPGQAATGECYSDEYPVHSVTLSHDYWLDATEVTQAEFEAVMGYAPSHFSGCGTDCPVEMVTWYESAAYANALSASEGLSACYSCSGSGASVTCDGPSDPYACSGYRLPTEAEWENAARCGTDLVFSGSDDMDVVAWTEETSGGSTRPVGGLPANACGLFDMSGNVYEWVEDWFDAGYYGDSPATDPAGPSSSSTRVQRSGSWDDGFADARVARRSRSFANDRVFNLGVRLARTVP